jgi:hypothetical protein
MAVKQQYPRRFHIGIDVGKEGAFAIQDINLKSITCIKMPLIGKELDMLEVYNILTPYEGGNGMIVFEKIIPFTANKSAMFSLGCQAGAIEMACVALAIPFTKVPPQTWQKEMFTGVDQATKKSTTTKSGVSRDTKSMALVAAKRLFPHQELKFGGRTTVAHNGLVDALLMSEYAKRRF